MSEIIDIHNPNYKTRLHDTYRYDLELRIGNKRKIRRNGSGRDAGTAGFSRQQLENIQINSKPDTIYVNYDFYQPQSTISKLISEDEDPDDFEVIIAGKNGTFIKTMLFNRQTNRYVFRTATYQTDHIVAKKYYRSQDPEYVVGKNIFLAGKSFWILMQYYFNQN